MRHARPRTVFPGPSRPVLPALLLTAAAGAFGGLALMKSPAPLQLPGVSTLRAAALSPASTIELQLEADLLRASRSRVRSVSSPAAAELSAAVAPTAPPTLEPTTSPRSTDGSELATGVARRFGGVCPVPAARFVDTWGAPRSNGRHHQGTDMLAPYGSPVYAVAAGVVETASGSSGGISLYLRTANGDRYFYAHNSANVARNGQRVQAGELIARVGRSGNARGGPSHVHFERQPGGGGSVNPYPFLRAVCR